MKPCYPVAICTLGCKLNQVESEAIADSFRKAGFSLVPWAAKMEEPGILIVNTCTVTSKADQKARRIIRKALRDNPESWVIVTGCYAQLEKEEIEALETESFAGDGGCACYKKRLFVLGVGGCGAGTAKSSLLGLPEQLLNSRTFPGAIPLEAGDSPFSFMPGEFAFHSRGYLKIQDGCDNACTYCRTRLARGPGVSLDRESALRQLLAIEAKGCAELMITGVNITQYRHGGLGLAGLLEYLLEGSTTINLRLSSLEPESVDAGLAAVVAHPRIRPHFHLSVQSGSDTVLRKMGRAYTAHTAEQCIAMLRKAKGDPFLACDIIAGFPGETDADFAQTLALCEKSRFAWIHAFPFSRRPGTAAFSFGSQTPERIVSQRVTALTELAMRGRREYARTWLGKELSAVVEKGKNLRAGECQVVSENYLKLIVSCSDKVPPPGTGLRCVPLSLCGAADGEKPDAVADIVF